MWLLFSETMKSHIFILLILNVVHLVTCSNPVWILKNHRESNCPSPDLGVSIEQNSLIKDFTFCGKYNFKFLRKTSLMSLGGTDIFIEMYDFERTKIVLKYDDGYYFFEFPNQTLMPNEWNQICLAVSMNHLKIALNGEISSNEKVDSEVIYLEMKTLWFGARSDSWFRNRRLEGAITDVYLWNESLTIDHLTLITSNGIITDLPSPDLFAWPPHDAKSNQPCYEYISVDENDEMLQNDLPEKLILVEGNENFNSSYYLCQAYGGKLFIPKNDEDMSKLVTLFKNSENCSVSWLGLKKSNDIVVDVNGKEASFVKWGKNQPNGKNWAQCIITTLHSGGDLFYDDVPCKNEYCYSCQIPTKSIYKLRGNIPIGVEREYYVELGQMSKDTKLQGFKETECFWNGTWEFGNAFGNNLNLGKSMSKMPPVGLQKRNKAVSLKFTQCHDDEFTCYTYGNCIPMTKRCNGYPDCPEGGSDENECKMISLITGYDKMFSQGKNANVSISINVLNIREINEMEMNIKVEVEVILKWFDSRVTFRNLKSSTFKNQLSKKEINQIWSPELSFLNSKGTHSHIKAGGDETVWINRKGSRQLNDLSELDEDYLYPGYENPIIMVSKMLVELDCAFDLTMYPFDTQRCPIKLVRPNGFTDQFVMQWDEVSITQHIQHTEFDNLGELGYNNGNTSMTIVKVEIILCRKLSYYIVNIYIPTLCLILIAEFTLFIDFRHFEASIMVALTSMLVMYTLYQGTSKYLPHTSYMKMMDIWLFGGLILPFDIIAIQILMDYLVMNECNQVIDMKKETQLNSKLFLKTMQVSLPIISGTFCIIYWIIGLYYNYHDCTV